MDSPAKLRNLLLWVTAVLLLTGGAAHGEFVDIKQVTHDLSELSTALEKFSDDCSRYPTTAEGLAALTMAPPGVTNWKGPYVTAIPTTDPWKLPYQYISPGIHNPRGFDLASAGRDGKFGTDDDFDNWSVGTGHRNPWRDLPSLVLGLVVVVLVVLALRPALSQPKPAHDLPAAIPLSAEESAKADYVFLDSQTIPLLNYGRPKTRSRLPMTSLYAINALLILFMYFATVMSLRELDVHVPVPEFPGVNLWQQLNPNSDYIPMQPFIWSIAFWSIWLAIPVTWLVRMSGRTKAGPAPASTIS